MLNVCIEFGVFFLFYILVVMVVFILMYIYCENELICLLVKKFGDEFKVRGVLLVEVKCGVLLWGVLVMVFEVIEKDLCVICRIFCLVLIVGSGVLVFVVIYFYLIFRFDIFNCGVELSMCSWVGFVYWICFNE